MRHLHELPKFRDRWAFLYVERSKVDKDADGIYLHDARGKAPVPIDQLGFLMLGPGTTITHAAAKALAENNCLISWVGQDAIRLYAHSTGGTFSSKRIIEQARLVSDPELRAGVARRMYNLRFEEPIPEDVSLEQIRGMEGRRVRDAYLVFAGKYDLKWEGRDYDPGNWNYADPVNRALSAANSCLYGLCYAAIVSAGFAPALGFIHSGKMLSFVYDVADFYKTDLTIPVAFGVVSENPKHLERAVREACRWSFHEYGLMKKIIPDIMEVLDAGDSLRESAEEFEGEIITLDDRTFDWDIPGESFGKSQRTTDKENKGEH